MTDTESILAGVDGAEAAFGTITILVNNAGVPDGQRAHKMHVSAPKQSATRTARIKKVTPRILAGKGPTDR